MSNQKGFVNFLIIGVVALIIAGIAGGGYWAYQNAQEQKQNEETQSQDQENLIVENSNEEDAASTSKQGAEETKNQQQESLGEGVTNKEIATSTVDQGAGEEFCNNDGDCYASIVECDKNIQDHARRNRCYIFFAVAKRDLSICDTMQTPAMNQISSSTCYLAVAEDTKDSSICDKLVNQDTPVKDDCYTVVSIAQKDISICDKIQSGTSKGNCYLEFAKAEKDISVCEKMSSQSWKDECYSDVAYYKQDLSICEKIQGERAKDSCYSGLARVKKDLSICDKIQGQEEKDFCYSYITAAKKDISIKEELTKKIEENKKLLEDKNNYDQGIAKIKENDWSGAKELLLKVSEGSSLYEDAKSKVEILSEMLDCKYRKGTYEMKATDSQGRVTGLVDGKVKQEIPESFYEDGHVNIYEADDNYIYEFYALEGGNYQFTLIYNNPSGGTELHMLENIPISKGETHKIKALSATMGVLSVDNNKDGKYEKEISFTGNLSCPEYIARTKMPELNIISEETEITNKETITE
ncbi:MAG: hypothetical protein WCX77_02830 [Candidatus Paceibacterota bacterium]|jgi:hypothetical protein